MTDYVGTCNDDVIVFNGVVAAHDAGELFECQVSQQQQPHRKRLPRPQALTHPPICMPMPFCVHTRLHTCTPSPANAQEQHKPL